MTKISFNERLQISQFLNQGKTLRQIAIAMNRSPSSISQELRRQGQDRNSYNPYLAQEHAELRKAASRRDKKIDGPLEEVIDLLLIEQRFSPEQISGYLQKRYPSEKLFQVCPETIYRHIYNSSKKVFYIAALRRKRKKRYSNGTPKARRSRIPNLVSIEQRPYEVNARDELGHWEGDLIIGKQHKTAIGTLVERSTRYTIIVPFIDAKDAETVAEGFSKALHDVPCFLKKTLTYDQGSEMYQHEKFSAATGMQVYFAHPGSPWERGTNENTNGLIRDFFPKGTDFRDIPCIAFLKVMQLLNNRPRKVLGFTTPHQVLTAAKLTPNAGLKDLLGINS
jgi:transposase, IS30 family